MRHVHLFSIFSLALLAACGDSSQPLAPPDDASFAAITETTNEFVPISFTQFVPCANAGAGEDVLVEGTIHRVFHATETPNGLRLHIHENFQGVTGTGLTTGDTYQGAGNVNAHLHLAPGVTETFERQFLLVGPGPDNNLRVRESHHLTVNANGELTTVRDDITVECS
jgi:hypothetical protein